MYAESVTLQTFSDITTLYVVVADGNTVVPDVSVAGIVVVDGNHWYWSAPVPVKVTESPGQMIADAG